MTTLTYVYVDKCQGGGHVRLDVTGEAGPTRRFVYTTDEIRQPLSVLTDEQRAFAAEVILKLHFQGKSRAQMQAEFDAGPVTVTI